MKVQKFVTAVIRTIFFLSLSSTTSPDPVWQGDPSLGQPPSLLQLLRAIPPELPAQRVADPSCLTVQCQPGAPRRRGAGGGRGRRRFSFPGIHVALLTFLLFQPLIPASPVPPPATPVEAAGSAGNFGGLDLQRLSCSS